MTASPNEAQPQPGEPIIYATMRVSDVGDTPNPGSTLGECSFCHEPVWLDPSFTEEGLADNPDVRIMCKGHCYEEFLKMVMRDDPHADIYVKRVGMDEDWQKQSNAHIVPGVPLKDQPTKPFEFVTETTCDVCGAPMWSEIDGLASIPMLKERGEKVVHKICTDCLTHIRQLDPNRPFIVQSDLPAIKQARNN
jgi:hypothetical protein